MRTAEIQKKEEQSDEARQIADVVSRERATGLPGCKGYCSSSLRADPRVAQGAILGSKGSPLGGNIHT